LEQTGIDLELLPSLKKCKLTYYGNILKIKGDTLEKDIIIRATPCARRKESPQQCWVKDTKDWMGLPINTAAGLASDRRQWRLFVMLPTLH